MSDLYVTGFQCPFCPADAQVPCPHFLGWTDDGRHVTERPRGKRDLAAEPIRETDRIVMTGVSARVYRPA